MSVEIFQSHASKLTPPDWPVSLRIVGDKRVLCGRCLTVASPCLTVMICEFLFWTKVANSEPITSARVFKCDVQCFRKLRVCAKNNLCLWQRTSCVFETRINVDFTGEFLFCKCAPDGVPAAWTRRRMNRSATQPCAEFAGRLSHSAGNSPFPANFDRVDLIYFLAAGDSL